MPATLRVLIVEDNPDDTELLVRELRRGGYEPVHERVDTAAAFEAALDRQTWDVILADYTLPGFSGLAALGLLRRRGLDTPLLLVSGSIGEDLAVEALKAGANDYLMKDKLKRLVPALEREFREAEGRRRRRMAEEALHLRNLAVEACSQGILLTDPRQPNNPIIYANPAFYRMTGYSPEEVLGRDARFLQGPETDADALATLVDAARAGRSCHVEMLNYRKDGSPFWNEMHVSPVRDEAGDLTHFVGVLTDVTGRKQLEAQFHQSQKMEAVGRLAGGIAHDFNNLLTAILGHSELLREGLPAGDFIREGLEEIGRAGERAAGLTRQLLAFSRKQLPETRVLDLNALVANMDKMIRRLIGEDVQPVVTLRPGLRPVKTDAGLLEQVLLNLVVNARDAMPRGGRLTVETGEALLTEAEAREYPGARPGWHTLLAVRDTGCGIDDDTKAHLFEPYFTTKEHGTGLGLSTVYGIVKQSAGHVRVESAPGRGSSFVVYLPSAEEPVVPAAAPVLAPPARGAGTVLVVEDEENLRRLVGTLLRGQGYEVLDARGGTDALAASERYAGSIDLLVTDVVMPEMSGRELADRLLSTRPGLRVVYMSGHSAEAVGLHGGPSHEALLQKPFRPEDLVGKVREALA
jgi:two-component system, cell cycle sensor histidine kinase and response regulator CckA